MSSQCSIDGCTDRIRARGWCSKHYQRWTKHGNPEISLGGIGKTAEQRFWEKVNKDGPTPEHRPELGPCWVWTHALMEGYGAFWFDGRNIQAHLWLYPRLRSPIPDGLELDHLCRNPACCNPDHLEPVTHRENVRRGTSPHGVNINKTHCPQGHPYSKENTRVSSGRRFCITCSRAACLKSYYKRRAKAKG